jgi:hypothetical protein
MDHYPVEVDVTVIDAETGHTRKDLQLLCGCTHEYLHSWGHHLLTPG